MSSLYPYADRLPVNRGLPQQGRSREAILEELRGLASAEDEAWEDGQCSGSMYCGDHDHYGFMNEVFGLFGHMNILQRDMCPSATRFEGEVIAMALDLMHGSAAEERGHDIAGMVTSGGSGSIMHAMLAYRDHAKATKGITNPNVVKPETSHPAFDKGCHLFGIEVRNVPVDPDTTTVNPEIMAERIDENTIAIVGSACNYGYGTIDPIPALSEVAERFDVGLHVDGCLGGFILPFGEELGTEVTGGTIPVFDFRLPGVTSISADTHKYGYGLKGTSTLLFRDKEVRNSQYFFRTDWTGGKYCSPGMDGSRSGGLLAATWASMVSLGREGYLDYARQIFSTASAMQDAVRSHSELRIIGDPTFCFSFTSDVFDIYHVNDFMKLRGWRFNGQQYPNAIHMAVTRPQTQDGVLERFVADLAEAVPYAVEKKDETPGSAAVYGGVAGGMTDEADEFITSIMADMMDKHQGLPLP
ncbi:pyridoxal phosphate-dependent decarboxylase family protein [Actinospongicola halichondriae]|uniref:pyridoxal phosphate-dependent decarboxylase family protein n=1 Tax=Actinospongicola halichondriae TaxID=3236844 RepID=UPI003D584E32